MARVYTVTYDANVTGFLDALAGNDWRAASKALWVYRFVETMLQAPLTEGSASFHRRLADGTAIHLVPDLDDEPPRLEVAVLVRGDRAHVYQAGTFATEAERATLRRMLDDGATDGIAALADREE